MDNEQQNEPQGTPQPSDAVDEAQRKKEEAAQAQADSSNQPADFDPEQVLQQVGDPTVGGVNRTNATLPEGEAQIRDDAPSASQIGLVPNAGEDVGEDQFSEEFNKDLARGFRGAATDPTPNENYTVAGVTRGAPTPETHSAQRAAARESRTLNEGVDPI